MSIKVKIKKKKSEPEASYPRLGVGDGSGSVYVQRTRGEDWLLICSTDGSDGIGKLIKFEASCINPLKRGQSVTLTQE